MAALNGDKIERLLWENGVDFDYQWHFTNPEVLFAIGPYVIANSDVWEDGLDWYLESEGFTLFLWQDGEIVAEIEESVEDEQEFVDLILSFGDER